jgi:hypothetical protein
VAHSPRPEDPIVRPTSLRATCCALLVALPTLSTPRASRADVTRHIAAEGGLGVGAAVLTLVYAPLKLIYAAGGLALAGTSFFWTMGNRQVSGAMVRSSVAGDYVITPDHLLGRDTFHFRGALTDPGSS